MTSLETIIAQIEAYGVSAKNIKSQYLGVSQIDFEIDNVSVADFNTLVGKYKGKIVMGATGKAFFLIHNHREDYNIAIWSVPCEASHPVAIKELETLPTNS